MTLKKVFGVERLLSEEYEQKIIPNREPVRHEPPVCCCTNAGKVYLLDGRRVFSMNAGCRVHSNAEFKWIGKRTGVEA